MDWSFGYSQRKLRICVNVPRYIQYNILITLSAKSLQTPSNIFVVNLAICDFLMMIKTPIFIYNSFNRGFASGIVGYGILISFQQMSKRLSNILFSCQVFAFIGSLSGIGAGMTNACIAYDRYNVITRPFESKLTRTKALFIVFLIWGYTVPWAVLPLMEVWGRYVPGEWFCLVQSVKRFKQSWLILTFWHFYVSFIFVYERRF